MRVKHLILFLIISIQIFGQKTHNKNPAKKDYAAYYKHLEVFYNDTNVARKTIIFENDSLFQTFNKRMDSITQLDKHVDSLLRFEPRYHKDLEYINGYDLPTFAGLAFDGNMLQVDYSKMTLLFFWNLSTQTSIDYIPYLNDIQTKYHDKLDIISLCSNTYEEVFHYHNTNKINFPIIYESNSITYEKLKLKGMTSKCILIDNTGKVLMMINNLNYKKKDIDLRKLYDVLDK